MDTVPARQHGYTICSAIVEDRGKIILKQKDEGLSLLGGFVDWSHGFPGCLVERVRQDHGLQITPWHINGIYQYHSGTGLWFTNINVYASLDYEPRRKGLCKIPLDDLLSGRHDFRTPDTVHALEDLFVDARADLSYVHVTARGDATRANTNPPAPVPTHNGFTVVSAVIRSSDSNYLLMLPGRGIGAGRWSLIGGKLKPGEVLLRGIRREEIEETQDGYNPTGIVGVYVNQIEDGSWPNVLAVHCVGHHEDMRPPRGDEVEELRWIQYNLICKMKDDMFRTRDTRLAIMNAESLCNQRRLMPLSFVRDIRP